MNYTTSFRLTKLLDLCRQCQSRPGSFLQRSDVMFQVLAASKIIQTISIIIRCVFSFLSIGRGSTTWPANNCLQIMVCSCVIGTFSREKWQIASLSCQEVIKIWKQTWWSNDKLLNSVIIKYHDLSVSRRSIICLSLRLRQIYWSARHWQITIFCSTSSNNC